MFSVVASLATVSYSKRLLSSASTSALLSRQHRNLLKRSVLSLLSLVCVDRHNILLCGETKGTTTRSMSTTSTTKRKDDRNDPPAVATVDEGDRNEQQVSQTETDDDGKDGDGLEAVGSILEFVCYLERSFRNGGPLHTRRVEPSYRHMHAVLS